LFDSKLKEIFQAFLELDIKPDTTFTEAKRRYHDLLKVWHPDKYGVDLRLQELTEGKTKKINAAWMLVSEFYEAQEAISRQELDLGREIRASREKEMRARKNADGNLNNQKTEAPVSKTKGDHEYFYRFKAGLFPETIKTRPMFVALLTALLLFSITIAYNSNLNTPQDSIKVVDLSKPVSVTPHYERKTKIDTNAVSELPGAMSEAIKAYNSGNYSKAVEVFNIYAAKKDTVAQFYLGTMYLEGKGVSINFQEAERWYRRASEHGDAFAQNALANIYLNGLGVEPDFEEAARWFLLAAGQGNVDAQYNIGLMYLRGKGVNKDYSEAERWFQRSADKGNLKAKSALYRLNK
jgi:TPR repeat protein